MSLAKLMGTFYATCLVFIFVVLGRDRPVPRLFDLEVHQVHQGRTADRARHLVVRIGAAAHDGQAREPGRAASRPSAWSSRPATRSTSTAPSIYLTMAAVFIAQATNTPMTLTQQLTLLVRAAAHVQGRGRRHRQRLHRAGGHAVGGRQCTGGRPGADPGHRPLHVGSARADQPDRQRRRHGGGRQVDAATLDEKRMHRVSTTRPTPRPRSRKGCSTRSEAHMPVGAA